MALDFSERFRRRDDEAQPEAAGALRMTGGRRKTAGAGVVSRERIRQNVFARIDDIPTLPAAVMEVLKLLSNARSNIRSFEAALSKDQVLTGRLIKLANSTFYGTSRRITAIKEVILRLGLLSVRSLVLAASTSHILNRPMPGYGYKEGGMWEHSLATAMAARRLARLAGLDNTYVEEAFLAGLMHDIGKVVLAEEVFKQNTRFQAVAQEKGVLAAEEELFGITHVATGTLIAERWRFSNVLTEAIRGHHDPDSLMRKPTDDETTRLRASSSSTILHLSELRSERAKQEAADRIVPPLADLAHLGNAVTQRLGFGMGETAPPIDPPAPSALARMKLTEDHLKAIADDLTEEFNQMNVLFKGAGGGGAAADAE